MKPKSPIALRTLAVLTRAGVSLLVVVVCLGIFKVLADQKVEPVRTEAARRGLPVKTIRAEARPVARVWEGYGSARSMNAATVSAQISGRVVERPAEAEAGVPIARGAVILRLETVDAIARVNTSESSVASFQAQLSSLDVQETRLAEQIEAAGEELSIERRNLERVQDAARSGAGNQADLDNASGAVRRAERTLALLLQQKDVLPARRTELLALQASARSQLTQAQEDLSRTTIASPIAGVLQEVNARPGELVSIGQEVARVVDLSRIEVPLRLPISAAATVRIGDRAELRSDGPVPHTWAGAVGRIAPEADGATRTLTVFVEVTQDPQQTALGEPLLLPGQFVAGRVSTSEERPMVLVPRRAVSADRVMLASESKSESEIAFVAEPVPVEVSHYLRGTLPEIEPTETEWAAIASGLPEGARVIVTNLDQLVGGMAVDPTGAVAASAESRP